MPDLGVYDLGSHLSLGAVVEEGDEPERRVIGVLNAVHAATLGVDHRSGLHVDLFAWLLTNAIDLPHDGGRASALCELRIIVLAQIGDSLPFDDVVKLFAPDVLMRSFHGLWRDGH